MADIKNGRVLLTEKDARVYAKTRRKPTALCCGMNSYIMKDFACKNLPLMLLK